MTPDERAALTYQGIDPDTAPLSEINRVLTGMGEPALPSPGHPPAPGQQARAGAAARPPHPRRPARRQCGGGASEPIVGACGAPRRAQQHILQLTDPMLQQCMGAQGKGRCRGWSSRSFQRWKSSDPAWTLQQGSRRARTAPPRGGADPRCAQDRGIGRLKPRRRFGRARGALPSGGGAQHTADRGGEAAAGSSTPASTAASAPAPAAASGNPAAPTQPPLTDPLLGGLASDPLMAGLGSLAPALGALSGLPTMMGSMSPFGAGMGDKGGSRWATWDSGIGSAIRDAVHDGDGSPPDDKLDDLKDHRFAGNDVSQSHDPGKPDPLKDQPDNSATKPPAGPGGTQPAAADAAPAQAPAAAAAVPPPADTSVKLPDGTTVSAESAALAKAGRAVLAGANINDAYQQSGISLSAPGTPVAHR